MQYIMVYKFLGAELRGKFRLRVEQDFRIRVYKFCKVFKRENPFGAGREMVLKVLYS
jgi:hypothetical protein